MDGKVKQNYELAFDDYKKGMKYKEIAEKYGVSLSTVKSWASRYWEKGKSCNLKKSQPQKVANKGAQPGNKNAVGHGAPKLNKNAVKTGEFETLFFDTLKPDEMQLVHAVQPDKEQLLLQEIQLLTVREHRMLKRIDDIRGFVEYLESREELNSITMVSRKEGYEKGMLTNLKEYQDKLGQIQSIEDALTRVQARRQKAIEMLHKFGYDDARMELVKVRVEKAKLVTGSGEEDEKVVIVNDV